MRSAIAVSRCEVGGTVYLPGDPMLVTQTQLDELVALGAATPSKAVAAPSPPPPTTREEAVTQYTKVTGRPYPKKRG